MRGPCLLRICDSMKTIDTDRPTTYSLAVGTLALLVCLFGVRDAEAQFNQKPLAIGSLHQVYTETGGQQEYWSGHPTDVHFQWPAIYQDGVLRADALWLGARNVTGVDGEQYDQRVVHIGPRATGFGEFFPVEFTKTVRYEPTEVYVDDQLTLKEEIDYDEVDASLPSDQMVETRVNTLLGVTMTKRMYAWSQEYHDDYHVHEYILENTGHTGPEDDGTLADQTVEDVYLHFQKRYVLQGRSAIPGDAWGANVMNDIVGDGMEDYDVDFAAQYTWMGNSQNADMDPLGGPAWDDSPGFIEEGDDDGELTAFQFVGTVTLYADDATPTDGAPGDFPRQPSMTGHIDADDQITSANDAFNVEQMRQEYDFMSTARGEGPHMYPHHADDVEQDNDFTTAEGSPEQGRAGGWTSAFSYGPYTLAPGESVRIVMAEAQSGLSKQAAVRIGQEFKATANGGDRGDTDAFAPIQYDADFDGTISPDEEMGKNEWVMTGRDSLFQTFERALANFDSDYGIPQAPQPPRSFTVTSGVDEIVLNWETDENPAGGFELYRSRDRLAGPYDNLYQYERIAELEPGDREYIDDDVVRGANFYYYIQAVGEENTDGTGLTPTGRVLKSNRYYTQTYDPANLKRGPGETASDFQVVPNPYNIAADQDVRWDEQDRLGFLDVPGNCVITIYTEMGELVETIEHSDGSGDAFWDITTSDRQLVASGVYIAVVEDLESGDTSTKKFVIIR